MRAFFVSLCLCGDLRPLAAGVVNRIGAAVQVNLAGFLIAAALRKRRSAADEGSAGQRHRPEITAVSQGPQSHGEYRSIKETFRR